MKTNAPPIAKTEVIHVPASGERVSIVVEIGQPYQSPDGFWRTPVALHGLDGRLCDICGQDSLQSLSLAVVEANLLRHRAIGKVGVRCRVVPIGHPRHAEPTWR